MSTETDTGTDVAPVITHVPHPQTGEAVELTTATDEELVDYVAKVSEFVAELREHQGAVEAELIGRMDRDLDWSGRRVGDPKSGIQHELSVPSPDAGTSAYNADELLPALRKLVDDGTLSPTAAGQGMSRTVTVTLVVPLGESAAELAEMIDDLGTISAGGEPYAVAGKSKAAERANLTGIGRLTKLPAAKATLAPLERTANPPRKLKIKPIVKGA